tara:strand:+ start:21 stop:416 length:396 start_codon:yes stop_codon:yes gene_type:complete
MANIISKKKLREFGLLLAFSIPFVFGFLLPALSGHDFRNWTIWFGIIFLVFSIFNPNLLLYPYRVWMFIGHFLGLINSRIILGLVFLIVLVPISFLMKLFGYDPLRKKKINNKNTFKEDKIGYKIDLNRIF